MCGEEPVTPVPKRIRLTGLGRSGVSVTRVVIVWRRVKVKVARE